MGSGGNLSIREKQMKPTNYDEYEKRMCSFDTPLLKAGDENPLVHRIMKEYAIGHIITKEEALSQMVVGLFKEWTDVHKRYCEFMLRSMPIVLVPNHEK